MQGNENQNIIENNNNNEHENFNNNDEEEYEIDDIFSVCKLKKCLAELELKTFQDMLKNCGKIKCRENDDVKAQRDFLYIAI